MSAPLNSWRILPNIIASCAPCGLFHVLQHQMSSLCKLRFVMSAWTFSLSSPLLLCLFRAIIIRNNEVVPMTNEFTPESERQRLQYLVFFFFYLLCSLGQIQLFYRQTRNWTACFSWLYTSLNINSLYKSNKVLLRLKLSWRWWGDLKKREEIQHHSGISWRSSDICFSRWLELWVTEWVDDVWC